MKIENHIIKNEIPLSEINVAEIFLYRKQYWLKTAHCIDPNGNMLWVCVNIEEGFEAKFNSLINVISVNARLIIE